VIILTVRISTWYVNAKKIFLSLSQDFVAGCFGGAGQLITGHPFDTIKVVSQRRLNDIVSWMLHAALQLLHSLTLTVSVGA
jgi:hypothetical protein